MRTRTRLVTVAVAVVVAFSGAAASAGAAYAGPAIGPAPTEIGGICGTLLGVGSSAASLGKTIAARGAGWVSAIIAAGCLAKDLWEYSEAFNASPEGIANIKALKDRYAGYRFEDYMREFGCVSVDVPPANPDDVTDYGHTRWDCSRSPYANTD